jgi:hypothetical protein
MIYWFFSNKNLDSQESQPFRLHLMADALHRKDVQFQCLIKDPSFGREKEGSEPRTNFPCRLNKFPCFYLNQSHPYLSASFFGI